ncbi:DUF6668 family protein [Herbiconiux sp. VKM Ac-2851]|uniref:DUF6668 family protein n=1 Tax=Herbiconiux sp. VKM Ac-2851 TaxID=2739025 RepID=UPI0015639928|nr:DUF6668 family protein [Herbiconiux sp. VKM Ac-2851]NQX37102.1 hypothetical protein [Herbiconiux sp. VKM Ac-2851]
MPTGNPWLADQDQATENGGPSGQALSPQSTRTGVSSPQPGIRTPNVVDRLPRRDVVWPATIWWLGAHGGAGESTLATLAAGSRPAGHAWPIPITPGTMHRVVLVARSNYAGISAARLAATEWASSALSDGIDLAGLVVIADAPGRIPKPLRDFERIVAGGVPHMWRLPWIDAWRVGPVDSRSPLPKEFRQLFSDLQITTSSTPAHH